MIFRGSLLRPLLALICTALVAGITTSSLRAQNAGSLRWKCSTAASPWTNQSPVPLGDTVSVPKPTDGSLVLVDSHRQLQVIDGWGGCFNERGWKAMEVLSPTARAELLHALFDPQDGLRLNLGRTPIGASDYATTLYSLDETPGDYALKHFSIDRDREKLIPFIQAAFAIQPDLKLWAVPWSPPSWMKTNGNLVGGYIKDDDRIYDSLSQYFVKYIQAYAAAGVKIGMVMPQNEPAVTSDYTSCQWTGAQLAHFIGHHLGPALEHAGLDTKIFLGTINDSSRGAYAYWVAPSMQDAQTRHYLAGVGCQWDAAPTMAETHFLFPEEKLMQSEAECGQTNSNDWAFAEKQYGLAKKWFNAGAGSNMIWNLVLDETGHSTANWAQCSPVVVNSHTGKITYTPYFYCYKHFSAFVQPGAHFVATQSEWGDKLAFVNPDGEVVLVMGNSANDPLPVRLHIDGKQSAVVTLPAHSFSTFTLAGSAR